MTVSRVEKDAQADGLRPLGKQHMPSMIVLRNATQTQHYERQPHIFEQNIDENVFAKELREYFPKWNLFRKRTRYATGWFVEGELAGYVLYYFTNFKPNAALGRRLICFVFDISVRKQNWRQGIGAELLSHVKSAAKARGASETHAFIWGGNDRSVGLFERENFQVRYSTYELLLDR